MLFGHGWSEQMRQQLNAPLPNWLSIGAETKVFPSDEIAQDQAAYRPVSGDSKSTRNRVIIPGRGIEIKVDYPIRWYRGSSLSPDGSILIINAGMRSLVYKLLPDGSHFPVEMNLPQVTYDAGPKGFISCWSWADSNTLIGEAEIDTEKGEFIERRIYVFHVDEGVMSRLDISALNQPSTEGLTVSKVGVAMNRLVLSVGGSEFAVNADLKTTPKIISKPVFRKEADSVSTNEPNASPKPVASPGQNTTAQDSPPAPSIPWVLIIVLSMLTFIFLCVFIKRKQRNA